MRTLSRHRVHKGRSAAKFRKHAGKTKFQNVRPHPMRGGFRL